MYKNSVWQVKLIENRKRKENTEYKGCQQTKALIDDDKWQRRGCMSEGHGGNNDQKH